MAVARAAPAVAAPETVPVAGDTTPKAEAAAQQKPVAEPAKPVPQPESGASESAGVSRGSHTCGGVTRAFGAANAAEHDLGGHDRADAAGQTEGASGCRKACGRTGRASDCLRCTGKGKSPAPILPFAAPTPAAVFRRANALWLVFDSAAKLNVAALKDDKMISRAAVVPAMTTSSSFALNSRNFSW